MNFEFKFPDGFNQLSIWQIACRITGQNTFDNAPSNETQATLAHLSKLITQNPPACLPVVFDLAADGPAGHVAFLKSFKAKYGRDDMDWSRYKSLFVRRDDWDKYSSTHRPGDHLKKSALISRQKHQEQEILRVIEELGHIPLNLKKNSPGKAGVKSAVKNKLKDSIWQGTVFDKAWERLLSNQNIKYTS